MGDQFKTEIQRVNGYLREIVTFFDSSGRPISQVVNPLMVELKPRDVFQLFVGSFLIATPLCFTEEVWNLSVELPRKNAYFLGLLSLVTVILFIYFNFYRYKLKGQIIEFIKRVLVDDCTHKVGEIRNITHFHGFEHAIQSFLHFWPQAARNVST